MGEIYEVKMDFKRIKMKHFAILFSIFVLQLLTHININVKHNDTKNLIENYIQIERKNRMIFSESINNKIDDLEYNMKSILDENLTIIREEIEFNSEVLNVISELIEDET